MLRPRATSAAAQVRRDFPVSAVLQPFVERLWSVSWDRAGQAPYRAEVLSHPSVNLSVETGDGSRYGHRLPCGLVHGVVTHRFQVDLTGQGWVSAVKFRPGGFTALTGFRAEPDTVRAVSDPRLADAGELVSEVLRCPDPQGRAAALDGWLAARAGMPEPDYRLLLEVLGAMQHDRTLTRVEQAAEQVGRSRRWLQRLFSHYLGVGPKWVLTRYRLQSAAAAIDDGEVGDLAALAVDLGWFDQAHFSRDFRSIIGTTPSAYLAAARAERLSARTRQSR